MLRPLKPKLPQINANVKMNIKTMTMTNACSKWTRTSYNVYSYAILFPCQWSGFWEDWHFRSDNKTLRCDEAEGASYQPIHKSDVVMKYLCGLSRNTHRRMRKACNQKWHIKWKLNFTYSCLFGAATKFIWIFISPQSRHAQVHWIPAI